MTWDSNSLGPTKKTLLKLVCDQLPNTMVEFYRQYNLIQDGKYYWLMAFTMAPHPKMCQNGLCFRCSKKHVQLVVSHLSACFGFFWHHTSWYLESSSSDSCLDNLDNSCFQDTDLEIFFCLQDGIQRTNAALLMSGSWSAGKGASGGRKKNQGKPWGPPLDVSRWMLRS